MYQNIGEKRQLTSINRAEFNTRTRRAEQQKITLRCNGVKRLSLECMKIPSDNSLLLPKISWYSPSV